MNLQANFVIDENLKEGESVITRIIKTTNKLQRKINPSCTSRGESRRIKKKTMSRIKYGIDLGTTNSAIAIIENR